MLTQCQHHTSPFKWGCGWPQLPQSLLTLPVCPSTTSGTRFKTITGKGGSWKHPWQLWGPFIWYPLLLKLLLYLHSTVMKRITNFFFKLWGKSLLVQKMEWFFQRWCWRENASTLDSLLLEPWEISHKAIHPIDSEAWWLRSGWGSRRNQSITVLP